VAAALCAGLVVVSLAANGLAQEVEDSKAMKQSSIQTTMALFALVIELRFHLSRRRESSRPAF